MWCRGTLYALLPDGYCAVQLLQKYLSHACYATTTVLFHRFYHHVSLQEVEVWSVAMASVVLAAKVEECSVQMRHVICVFAHLYRRQTLVLVDDKRKLDRILNHHPDVAYLPSALSLAKKKRHLRDTFPSLSILGPVWNEWHNAILQTESKILRQLGFTLYWIPDHHPHKFLSHFVSALIDDKHHKELLLLNKA